MSAPVTTEREAAELLSRLVATPSVTPGVEGGTGEGAVADLVEEFARSIGAQVTRQEVYPGRDNVICTIAPDAPGPHLLLEAHMDTVALGPMTDGHQPRMDADGRLHGRGSCDTKGSLAGMLLALQWAAGVSDPAGPLTVAAAVDEETGSAGAKALPESGLRVDGAVVGEPTSLGGRSLTSRRPLLADHHPRCGGPQFDARTGRQRHIPHGRRLAGPA